MKQFAIVALGVMAIGITPAYAHSAHTSPSTPSTHFPVLAVPNSGFAQINLPRDFSKIVFPPGTQLDGKVVSLHGGTTILIKFKPHSIKHMIIGYISMANGQTLRVGFRQVKGASPPVWNAPGVSSNIPKRNTEPAVGWIVHKMKSTVMNGAPTGMSSADLPRGGNLGPIQVIPLAAWTGGGYKLLEYKLTSSKLESIEPRNFYRKGVVAVLTQSDTVSKSQSPKVLIMERDANE